MRKDNIIILKFIISILVILLITIFSWRPLSVIFSSPELVKEFIGEFGIIAPLILIVLVALQVLIAPIPGQFAGLASGYIFGAFFGTIYSMIGLAIGSYFAFLLSRKFGRPFVEKVVKRSTLRKFDNLSEKLGVFTLFLIYLLPVLPDDAISYIAGLTKIRIRTLMIISIVGRFPGFLVLNLVGDWVASYNSIFSIVMFLILMFVSVIVFIYKDELENIFLGFVHRNSY